MTVSEQLRSCWGQLRLGHQGNFLPSHWSKPLKLHWLPFEWRTKSLLWYLFQYIQWKATSVTPAELELEFWAIFVFLWMQLWFIHKTQALSSLFSYHHVNKLLWAIIQLSFTEQFNSRIVVKAKNWQAKELNFTCQTISVCELLQNIFDSFSLVQPIRLLESFKDSLCMAYGGMLFENIKHADDNVVCFRNRVCFENLKLYSENLTDYQL